MNLLFVTDNGFSSKNGDFYYSGANIQHYSNVTSVFENIVFIARSNEYDYSASKISNKYKVYLIDSITSNRKVFGNYLEMNRVLEKEVKKSDVVMCFGLNGYLAYKKAKKYKKKTIAYVGGCVYDTLKNMDSFIKRSLAPVMMKFIKEMVFDSDYVHYVDEYLTHRYPTKGKYLICPSANVEIQNNVLINRLKKIETSGYRTNLGLIGYTHNKIKGIDTAIKALSLLDDSYKLEIVGRGDHSWLDKIACEYKVEKRVEFLGVLKGREEIFEWLDTIDIYLQPSVTEGMPRATVEAMSRACPVITTNVGGLLTLVNQDYQIDIGDYESLSSKVMSLKKKQKKAHVARENFDKARKFDVDLLNEKRKNFYNSISKR